MRPAPILMFSIIALLFGCGSSAQSPAPPAAPEQPATIYAPGNGGEIWHFRGNRQWSGFPGQLGGLPISEAPATVSYSRSAGVACVDLGGGSAFGAPDLLRVGTRFQCGTARFEVVACEFTDNCHIRAIWRVGVPPNGGELPVNYFYSRCRGILSIAFDMDPRLRVSFGEPLELRYGPGLLARPDAPGCGFKSELYGGPRAPKRE